MSRDRSSEPDFDTWFSGSKVVDAEGQPLVLYHGTSGQFDRFHTGRGAIYFTSEGDVASAYALNADAYDANGYNTDPFPHVICACLSIKNPLTLDEEWAVENLDWDDDRDWMAFDEVVFQAERKGHDGVVLKAVVDFSGTHENGNRLTRAYDQYIVFSPKQIRSAFERPRRMACAQAHDKQTAAVQALDWLQTLDSNKMDNHP